jgi:hypothetical protein
MREWLEKIKPNPWLSRKLLMAAVLIAVGVGAFCWGRRHANAQPPGGSNNAEAKDGRPEGYGTRIVAYYHNQPVFREELGEYLIQRFGAERVAFLVNRKIVEAECRKHNIVVTDEEVNYRYRTELLTYGGGQVALTEADFVNNFLRRFNKTLFEWKEDVIRPKLMMEKLVRSSIKITNDDVKDGFEARYGPKVECRMIVLKDDHRVVDEVWTKIHNSPQAFLVEAEHQFIPTLAKAKGLVPPIHKHFGDKKLEDAAFRLKEGEISSSIHMEDGSWVILLCEKHLPENKAVRLEHVYQQVHKEMEELRVAQKLPELFKQIHDAANPQILLKSEAALASAQSAAPATRFSTPGQPQVQMPPSDPLPPLPPATLAPGSK